MNRTSLLTGTMQGVMKTILTDAASAFAAAIALRDRLKSDGGWAEHEHMLGSVVCDIDSAIAKLQNAKEAVEQARPVED